MPKLRPSNRLDSKKESDPKVAYFIKPRCHMPLPRLFIASSKNKSIDTERWLLQFLITLNRLKKIRGPGLILKISEAICTFMNVFFLNHHCLESFLHHNHNVLKFHFDLSVMKYSRKRAFSNITDLESDQTKMPIFKRKFLEFFFFCSSCLF